MGTQHSAQPKSRIKTACKQHNNFKKVF